MNQGEKLEEPRSNIEWRRWAQTDPLYGVATLHGRDRNGERPWTLPEFYSFGRQFWRACLPHWEQYGLLRDHCVEIGCGAGRITQQLVEHFTAVTGVDISARMLGIAQEQVPGATFTLGDGRSLPLADSSASAVFSCEVFQHFNTRGLALTYFREIFRILHPTGSSMIQLPLAILPLRRMLPAMDTVIRALWRASEEWVRLKSDVKRVLIAHRDRRPFLFMLQYEPEWLREHLAAIGFADIEIRMFPVPMGDHSVLYAHLFMRKPSVG